MSGGFNPNLVTTTDPLSGQINVLASQHMAVKAVGVTVDAATVTADSKGHKYLLNGTILSKIDASGKYGPYDAAATDGRQSIGDTDGIIIHGGIDLKDGDVITGILLHGSVLEARILNLDAAAKAALSPRIIFQ